MPNQANISILAQRERCMLRAQASCNVHDTDTLLQER